jgi:plasmid replication initiation protein
MAAPKRIPLLPRSEFAELSLHEKNAYLQDVARQIQSLDGEAPEDCRSLDKESLSRLRRYYARRTISELKLEEVQSPGIRQALQRMSDAIRAEEICILTRHEIPTKADTGRSKHDPAIMRDPPVENPQMEFFVPQVHDAPIKDEFSLLDIAPFTLSKSSTAGVITYELKDAIIRIEGGAQVGLATAWDYDIVINMISYLADAMRQYHIDERKGLRPSLPPRVYRPAASDILRFCRRELGGKQYIDLEKALDRLQATRIKITSLTKDAKGSRRDTEATPMIGRYRVVSRTNQDRIDLVEIEIPDFVYNGVVRPDGKPTILTLNPDYFLITRPIARFVYRLARKAAGETEARYSLSELRKRSGSKLPTSKFRTAIEEIVAASKLEAFPDYDLEIEEGRKEKLLHMRCRPTARQERRIALTA